MGATIDYAVLFSSRFLENINKGLDSFVSAKATFSSGVNAILVSAGTMFLSLLPLGIFSQIFMVKNLAMLVSRGALISFLSVSIFVLPLLVIFYPILSRTGIGWNLLL